MAYDFSSIRYPELVFGIAGPIGIDIDAISAALSDALHTVNYESIPIRLTEEIASVPSTIKIPVRNDYYTQIKYKMDHTSQLCRDNDDSAWAMRFVVDAIRRERARLEGFDLVTDGDIQGDAPFVDVGREDKIQQSVAYIIRQIKRPEEVKLLRNIYGKQFVLISAFASEEDRVSLISEKIKRTLPLTTKQ